MALKTGILKLSEKIPPFVKFICKLFSFQFLIFTLLRFVFYLFTFPSNAKEISFSQKLLAFRMGFEFDMIIICYSLLVPLILLFLYSILQKNRRLFSFFAFLFVFVFFSLTDFIWAADIPLYKQFGTHLSNSAFQWNSSPGFILGIVFGSFSYWGFLILFLFFSLGTFIWMKPAFRKFKEKEIQFAAKNKIAQLLWFIVITGLLLLGGRGRTSPKSTTHEGLAIISENHDLNSLALNPSFTLFRSLLHKPVEKYKVPQNIDEYIGYTRNYLGMFSDYQKNISRTSEKSDSTVKKNVVLVFMESMSVYKLGKYNGKVTYPNMNKLISESVYFENFFSSGIHTFNGLFSGTSGFPSINNEQGLKTCTKKAFNSLGPILSENGYENYFFTTHDPEFDNMAGYFKMNDFKNIYSEYQMPAGKALSTLGAPDHILYDKFIEVMNARKVAAPFLSVLMTGSDHGPWKIPSDISFKPTGLNEQENAALYADWALGEFIKKIKMQAWYKNTIFIFTGDHGLSVPGNYEMPITYHHVPLVFHNALAFPEKISNLGYQPDLTASILGLLKINYTNETFGINLFKESHPFVVFTADNKTGCIDKNGYFYYQLLDSETKRLFNLNDKEKKDYYTEKRKLADSLEYGCKAILESTKYFLRKDYFNY
ncbi:MAG: LTA synthase family protein [Bacteroidia bacterium]|nr:LTA synthase family protein [Bacteroidia bacterium]